MKTGKSLQDLAAEIERQAKTKTDYVAATPAMSIVPTPPASEPPQIALKLGDKGLFPIGDIAHDQIAEHVKIPKPYYERMRRSAPDLLATNVNRWFNDAPAKRMVRVLDQRARAFLSDAYRPLDNYDFAHAVLPILAQRKLDVMSCEITERRLYIKAVDQQLFRDVPVGYKMGDGSHRIFDTCAPAVVLSNSEVGFGRLVIETGVYTRACTNLALFSDGGMKRTHVGARHKLTDNVENIDHLLSDRTKQKTDEALWMQARDVLAAAFSTEKLGERLELLAATAENRITGKVEKVVEVTATKFALNDGERESVLRHLIEGGSLTQYGLHAAITRSAQDNEDYDRATELEYLGGKVITLPRTEWEQLAQAA